MTDRNYVTFRGRGLNVSRRTIGSVKDTNAGFNLLAGAESLRGIIHPFGEARATLKDHSTFQIVAGLNITLGRHEAQGGLDQVGPVRR